MSVLESIVHDLEALPPPKLMDVARYVCSLHPQSVVVRHFREANALLPQ